MIIGDFNPTKYGIGVRNDRHMSISFDFVQKGTKNGFGKAH